MKILWRLFKWNLLLQLCVTGLLFLVMISMVSVKLLYQYGLNSSLSKNSPHLILRWETPDLNLLKAWKERLREETEFASVGEFRKLEDLLGLEALKSSLINRYQLKSRIQVIGLEMQDHPFAIPMEQSTPFLKRGDVLTPGEIIAYLQYQPGSFIINPSLSLIVIPPLNETTEILELELIDQQQPLGIVSWLGVLSDYAQEPRLYISLQSFHAVFGETGEIGLYLRLKNLEQLEQVADFWRNQLPGEIQLLTWQDEQQTQQRLYEIFQATFWSVLIAIFVLALFVNLVSLYKAFITKRHSLSILQTLGFSKVKFFWSLTHLNCWLLIGGLVIALLVFSMLYPKLEAPLLTAFEQVTVIDEMRFPWRTFAGWVGSLLFVFITLNAVMLFLLAKRRLQLK